MLKPIPAKDMSHEFLWRQLLRALVDGVPDLVEPAARSPTASSPAKRITLRADVVDKQFVELNDASVVAHVSRPDGTVVDVPMQWSGERSGEYTATVPAVGAGQYEARIEATRGGRIDRHDRRSRPRGAWGRGVLRRDDACADVAPHR